MRGWTHELRRCWFIGVMTKIYDHDQYIQCIHMYIYMSVYIYIYVALKLFCFHAHLGCVHAYQTIIIIQTIAIPWISWVECYGILIVVAHGVSKFMISALFSLFMALPPGHPWWNNLTCRSGENEEVTTWSSTQSIEVENTKKKQRHLTQLGIGLDSIVFTVILSWKMAVEMSETITKTRCLGEPKQVGCNRTT